MLYEQLLQARIVIDEVSQTRHRHIGQIVPGKIHVSDLRVLESITNNTDSFIGKFAMTQTYPGYLRMASREFEHILANDYGTVVFR